MSDREICNTVSSCILWLDATRVGCAVADLDIMLEQPCATLQECAAVRDVTGLALRTTRMSAICQVMLGYVSIRLRRPATAASSHRQRVPVSASIPTLICLVRPFLR